MTDSSFMIKQNTWDPNRELFYESIFSLGNGYMGVRGFKGEEAGRGPHENGIYIAGVYDELKPGITDMVNTPDFMHFRISVDGEVVGFDREHLQSFSRELDMEKGVLKTRFTWRSDQGKTLAVRSERLVSMGDRHAAGLRYEMELDAVGEISVTAGINGDVCNNPIADEQLADNTDMVVFLNDIRTGAASTGVCWLTAATKTTGIKIAESFVVEAGTSGIPAETWETMRDHKGIYRKGRFVLDTGQTLRVDKRVMVYTSRDGEWGQNPWEKAVLPGYEPMLVEHMSAWKDKWEYADIVIEGDERAQQALRYSVFQLIQNNAEHDPYVSIGARGLMHGRYKGCYFWDTEIFMLPFYLYTNPHAAKNLLLYRYHTLPGAEQNAREMSLQGAKYAWMCTLSGVEQCETWDIGCCEVHVAADVSYAFWQYYLATQDDSFMVQYGAETLIKTARYWTSRFTYDRGQDAYHMLFVKGPDEYGGVTHNNTYTTIMAIYNLKAAKKAVDLIKGKDPKRWESLRRQIGFMETEIESWEDIARKAVIAYDPAMDLYVEDESTFRRLEPLALDEFKQGDAPLYRSIAFDRLQRYRVLKQADVLQLMLLLPHLFTPEQKRAAWDYYEPITAHDSSLSFGSHAAFAARLGLAEEAYGYFMKSARLDLDDIMENTDIEGIHPASCGITWQALVNGFGGVTVTPLGLSVSPCMCREWDAVRFAFVYRSDRFVVRMTEEGFTIRLDDGNRGEEAVLYVYGRLHRLARGEEAAFSYKDPALGNHDSAGLHQAV